MAGTFGGGAGTGGLGFFVPGLAVNDAGDAVVGVLADALPDAHHVAAGGVDKAAALGLKLLHGGHFGAERRNDDEVVFVEVFDVGVFFFAG